MTSNDQHTVDFRNSKLSLFALKYLSKFIDDAVKENMFEYLRLNGGQLPLYNLQINQVIELNLSNSNLYSEDLFILSKFMLNGKTSNL